MAKVSIIVPVYNVEKYIARCLESLVNQTLKDIEIVLVNDGSTDNSQAIIEQYQKKYPNIIKAYSTENGGAAKARNYALEQVTGEYIGFVDSDDYISEEMYEKLYCQAKKENADIVCCNYYRVKMETKFNKMDFGNKNIPKEDVFNKNIYESKLLFDEVPYLWNKIFKKEIIESNHFKFDNDLRIYEDLLFTYKVFAKANKIARVEDALYFYIVAREGALTQTLTEKRFDIFNMYEKLTAYYKELDKYEEVKEALLYAFMKHIYVILEKQTSWKEKKIKRRYLKEAFQYLNKNYPKWKENMYFKLQDRNKKKYVSKFYWHLCIIVGVNIIPAWNRLKRIVNKGSSVLFFRRPGAVYVKNCKKRINEKSIFIFPQQGSNLNGNMFYLVKELATNSQYNEYSIYIGYNNESKKKFESLLKGYQLLDRIKLIKNKTAKFAKVLATAKYLFTDTSFTAYFTKREGQVYLNTWHGTPLKTLGKSTENDFFDIANVQKNFVISDYLLYPSEFMKDIMIRDYMLEGIANNQVMLCGYPRNEIFLRGNAESVKGKLGLKGKTLIAYMPTWRGNVRDFDIELQLKIVENYIEEMSKSLKENQTLYVNMHPFIGNKLNLSQYENVKSFPKTFETYDFLSICDILITDYSSVFFDYAITKKKIILFTYDQEEYFRDRGVYLRLEELPFPKVKTVEEVVREINSPIEYDINSFLDKYCKYERNNISKLLCEKVILGKENEIKILPMSKSNKNNILFYLGNFRPNHTTKSFMKLVSKSNTDKHNYYVSYITRNLRPNKDIFKRIIGKLKFYGQLSNNTNLKKLDILLIKLLEKHKNFYNRFENRYHRMHEIELKRIYQDIQFKTVILYGELDYKKIYQLSDMKCKRIFYIEDIKMFNQNVNKKVYQNLDVILTADKNTYDFIKNYCGQDNNIKLINPINELAEFDQFIG